MNYVGNILKRLRKLIVGSNVRIGYVVSILVVVSAIRPILSSHWYGDDWPNSQTTYWNLWRYGHNSLTRTLHSAWYANQDWMFGQGRFFPINVLETNLLFHFAADLEVYKLAQFVVALSALLSAACYVLILSQSHRFTIVFLFSLALTIQFRRDFDPHIGFHILVTGTTLKLFSSAILFYWSVATRSRIAHLILVVSGGLTFFLAMSTYEHAFVLLGIPVLSIVLSFIRYRRVKRTLLAACVLTGVWSLYSWIVFSFLKSRVDSVIPRYQLSWGDNSVWILVSQIFSPLPLIGFDAVSDLRNNPDIAIVVVLGACLLSCLLYLAGRNLNRPAFTPKTLKGHGITVAAIGGVGVQLLVLPSLLLALRPLSYEASRIQGFQPQFTYLHIFISQIGAALLLAMALQFVLSRSPKPILKSMTLGLCVAYTLTLMLSISHNYAVARDSRYRELNYESWNALTKDEYLFSEIQTGDGMVSQTTNFAYETNPGNFYYRTGIRLSGMFWLRYLYSEVELSCKKDKACALPDLRTRVIGQLANNLRPESVDRQVPRGATSPESGDWASRSLKAAQNEDIRLWIFDLYPITSNSFIAYTAALDTDQLDFSLSELKFVRLTRVQPQNEIESISPSLAGRCLSEVSDTAKIVGTSSYPLQMTVWRFPDSLGTLNYLDLDFGVCS